MAYAVQARTHYQTYLERPPGADLPPKKVCNLDPMAPRSLYVAHCSGGFAEAVQLRRRYAVMKEAARARRR